MSKPLVVKEEDENGEKHIKITARSMEEASNIIKGLSKKYPQININELLKNAENRHEYLDNKINLGFSIGGEEAFRSICKTAVNYYMFVGGDRDYIIDLISYIRDGDKKDIVWFYYPEKDLIDKDIDEVLHSIILIGDPKEKILYAYIEFFNTFKFIILLNDNYSEKELEKTYIFDVVNKTEFSKNVYFKL